LKTQPTTLKRLWKNEYFQTAIMIILIVIVVLGFWFGSRIILNTDYPMLAVASGSMHLPKNTECDGWSDPFARTLHTGDLIIVEGVNVSEIYAAPYPNGTIIVYRRPNSDELIVHRAIGTQIVNGKLQYITQGDHNPGQDPPVPAENVIGKVIFRIPWVGHLALFMRNSSGVYLIIALIIILIIIELLIPMMRRKKPATEQPQQNEQTPQTDNSESGNATTL